MAILFDYTLLVWSYRKGTGSSIVHAPATALSPQGIVCELFSIDNRCH
jgi:hypothetical protein